MRVCRQEDVLTEVYIPHYIDGHEEVMRMAAALQGCPIVDAWKKTEQAQAMATATAAAT